VAYCQHCCRDHQCERYWCGEIRMGKGSLRSD
jgi:hypothetical protein